MQLEGSLKSSMGIVLVSLVSVYSPTFVAWGIGLTTDLYLRGLRSTLRVRMPLSLNQFLLETVSELLPVSFKRVSSSFDSNIIRRHPLVKAVSFLDLKLLSLFKH
jgi:hypothetical protein